MTDAQRFHSQTLREEMKAGFNDALTQAQARSASTELTGRGTS